MEIHGKRNTSRFYYPADALLIVRKNIIGKLENARGNSLQLGGFLAHRTEMRLDLFCLFLSDEERSRNMKKQFVLKYISFTTNPCSSSRVLRLHDVIGFYPIKLFVIEIQLEKDR